MSAIKHRTHPRIGALLSATVTLAGVLTGQAANVTWIGNSDTSLANGLNWDSSPSAPVSGDAWLFDLAGTSGSSLTNDLATSSLFEVGGLSFGASSPAFTLAGGSFSLTGNIVSTSANLVTIGSNINVSGARQINLNGTNGIALTGNLSGNGSLTQTAGGSGAKTVTLSGDNSGFFGTFTQNNDSNNRTAFSSAASGSANASWNLNRNVNGGVALNFTNDTINFGALSGGAYIRANSNGTVNVSIGALGSDTTFSGQFQQANGSAQMLVTKVGSGNLTLSGTNVHTGGTIVDEGTLTLAKGGSVGTVRGVVTVNSGGTLRTTVIDALGYATGNQVTQLNLNAGTFDNASGGNQGYLTNFNLTGGSVTSSGGGSINFSAGYGITSNASNTTSTFSAPITLRGGANMVVSVADGLAATDLEISGAIGEFQGTGGIVKTGDGTLLVSGGASYNGTTLVSAGTLYVTGSLGAGTTEVGGGATIGGSGSIAGNLMFDDGGRLDLTGATLGVNSIDILTVGGGATITLTNFSFADIVGWDAANAADGTYTLVNGGSSVVFGGSTPTSSNPYAFTDTKYGYFNEGSLQAVIYTVPEPGPALLGALGVIALLRRRR